MQVAEGKDSVRIITYDDNTAVSVHTKDTEKTALVTISSETDFITAHAGNVLPSAAEMYDGVYNVTPSQYAQELQTSHKMMERNVVVERIPYYETSNEHGTTVYIGE